MIRKLIYIFIAVIFLVSCSKQGSTDNEVGNADSSQITETDQKNESDQNQLLFRYEKSDGIIKATLVMAENVYVSGFETYITYSARNLELVDTQICKVDGVDMDTTIIDGRTYVYFNDELCENITGAFDIITFTFDQKDENAELIFSLEDVVIFDADFNYVGYSVSNTNYISN